MWVPEEVPCGLQAKRSRDVEGEVVDGLLTRAPDLKVTFSFPSFFLINPDGNDYPTLTKGLQKLIRNASESLSLEELLELINLPRNFSEEKGL